MLAFLDGLMFALLLVIALFQVRSWRRSGDRLFIFFAIAFSVFAINRVALTVSVAANETSTLLYVVRLLAFCVILIGIWDKNRRDARRPS